MAIRGLDEAFRREVQELEHQLIKLGLVVSPQIREYLSNRSNILGAVESDDVWFKSCYSSSMSDDHLISAGLSQMNFRRGIVVMSLETSSLVVNMMRGIMPYDVYKENHNSIVAYLKERFEDNQDAILIIPVC